MAHRRVANGAENYNQQALQKLLAEGVPYSEALYSVTTTFDGLPPEGNVHSLITGCGELNYDEDLPTSRYQQEASQKAHQSAVAGITPEQLATVKQDLYQESPDGTMLLRVDGKDILIRIEELDLTQEAHYDFVIGKLYNL